MSNSQGILSGLRVVDCATYIAGPAAATVMADFGADVIKVERPGYGDANRYLSQVPGMPVSSVPYCWSLTGRNKKSLALNLAEAEGRQILLRLAASADVFITNFQPQLLRKFQMTYEDLLPLNERLIYAYVNAYGEEGPEAESPGFDSTAYWARSGLMDVMHYADADPCISPAGFGDHPTSMTLLAAIMTGLYRRQITGKGMKVSTSLLATGSWSNACLIQAALVGAQFQTRFTRRNPPTPLVNHYVARDGKRFYLCLLNPDREWPQLCKATGLDDLEGDARYATASARRENSSELIAMLDRIFAEKDMAEWERLFKAHEIVWGAVPTVADVIRDPRLKDGGIVTTAPDGSGGSFQTVNNPLRFPGAAAEFYRNAPEIGQDTVEILSALGYTEDDIQGLVERAIVSCSQVRGPVSPKAIDIG